MLHTDFTAHVLGQLVRVNTRFFKKKQLVALTATTTLTNMYMVSSKKWTDFIFTVTSEKVEHFTYFFTFKFRKDLQRLEDTGIKSATFPQICC